MVGAAWDLKAKVNNIVSKLETIVEEVCGVVEDDNNKSLCEQLEDNDLYYELNHCHSDDIIESTFKILFAMICHMVSLVILLNMKNQFFLILRKNVHLYMIILIKRI